MPRLSVSIEEEQARWITEQKGEFGVSKSKVIRECINEVMTGDSLFTDSVEFGESPDEERISQLEQRLESLEETVGNQLESPGGDTLSNVDGADGSRDISAQEVSTHGHTAASIEESAQSPRTSQSPAPQDSAASGTTESTTSSSTPSQAPCTKTDDTPQTSSGSRSGEQSPSTSQSQSPSSPGASAESSSQEASATPVTESEESSNENNAQSGAPNHLDKSDPDGVKIYLEKTTSTEEHAAAVFACWEYLRDRGTLHVKSLKLKQDEYPLDYDDADDWWLTEIKPLLEKLPGVAPPEKGGNFYRFKF